MREPIRFSAVGARGYARTLLRYIQRLEEEGRGRLVAATLRNRAAYPEIAAGLEGQGVRVYDDYEAMLAACPGEVDVVVLPTAIHTHAPMAVAALQAGYHVFLEKPVAGSLAEVDQIIAARTRSAARDASGRQCAIGFQILYSRVIQTLKRYIVEGKLGRVQSMRILALWPRPPAYYARNSWAGRLTIDGRPVYDSPFNNALAHQIMNMLYLASPEPGAAAYPERVEAELYRAYDIESFDTGCMRAWTQDGVEVFFVASHACGTLVEPALQLVAERATVLSRLDGDTIITHADAGQECIEWGDFRMDMFHNVLDAVSGAVPKPICTLEVARTHVACIEALHRAASIVDVPAARVSVGEGGQRVIDGIDEAAHRAWASGKLFSELGVRFA
jgi:predicted dehydrogenase